MSKTFRRSLAVIVVCLLIFPLGLSSCGGKKDEKVKASAAKTYNDILDKLDTYDFGDEEKGQGKYTYTLAEVENQEAPLMLVRKSTGDNFGQVRVFGYDEKEKKALEPRATFAVGADKETGVKSDINITEEKPHIEYLSKNEKTGKTLIEKIDVKEDKVEKEKVWEGKTSELADSEQGKVKLADLEWTVSEDRKPLDELAGESVEDKDKKAEKEKADKEKADKEKAEKEKAEKEKADKEKAEKENEKKEQDRIQNLIKEKEDEGYIVLTGTVKHLSYSEILEVQNESDPNPGSDHSDEDADIFILDEPHELTLWSPGRVQSTRDAKVIKVIDFPESLLGEKVVIAINPERTIWPSDTSLPLGEPRTSDYVIIQ